MCIPPDTYYITHADLLKMNAHPANDYLTWVIKSSPMYLELEAKYNELVLLCDDQKVLLRLLSHQNHEMLDKLNCAETQELPPFSQFVKQMGGGMPSQFLHAHYVPAHAPVIKTETVEIPDENEEDNSSSFVLVLDNEPVPVVATSIIAVEPETVVVNDAVEEVETEVDGTVVGGTVVDAIVAETIEKVIEAVEEPEQETEETEEVSEIVEETEEVTEIVEESEENTEETEEIEETEEDEEETEEIEEITEETEETEEITEETEQVEEVEETEEVEEVEEVTEIIEEVKEVIKEEPEEPVEEEEEEGVFEIEIDDITYYTNDDTNGKIYAVINGDEVGDEVGRFVDGEVELYE